MTGALPVRDPGAELANAESVAPHVPPEADAMARVLACLRASARCWRCAADDTEAVSCGEVNGAAGSVPLCLCPACRRSLDGYRPAECWRCAASPADLVVCGEVTGPVGTVPLSLCPDCLGTLVLTYATTTSVSTI